MSRKKKVLLGIMLLLLLGITYEQIGQYFDSKKYKPVGQIININGHDMHIYAEGNGNATVVFASGWAVPSPYVDFYPLYSEISKYARTAVYDRPGYGWSDIADTPRDIDTITKEIHELLEKSGEKPPYILVGHSIGSLEVIRFAQLYENEVKGVVLIDGSNPDMYSNMVKPSTIAAMRASIFHKSIYLLNKSGISRLLFNIVPNFYSSSPLVTARNNLVSAPDNFEELDSAMFVKTCLNRNQVDEGKNKETNALEVVANGYINDVPLRIITSEELNNYEESKENQLNLQKWSTDSKQIVVTGSGHAIHWYNPEVINNEILEILNSY
ncbi:putative hydrolase or acyltransferase of alpha/beta superfamily [Desulfosporosinus orientis DSM 765]|uniref:Putative hydrolase or acyltransferase of alpha/beta superfamily n=1 Tax=Desulfosporosinus orientis (strain ATCC 19365 / DSM 765 / NCIMB 8382 / VKM B-1628 / Singapore I) TaxID=768706 RepID=G7WDF6_DESOD|nr:alpha/beta hydrolase [Desulfosporosinus orientis]AET67925.1 putative hydrolase or acyltransferase of alpha/beta superfamily [Desulfosporosinus orientis DSM 765]